MSDLAVPSSVARLNYFFGQLLTQRDLQAEQRFHLLLQRMMQRETLGTGTVAGLRVDAPAEAGVRGVFVRGGLALDPDGRELVLATDVCVVVADEARQPGQAGLTGDTYAALATSLAARWNAAIDELDAGGLGGDLKAIGVVPSSDVPTVRPVLDRVVPPAGFVLPPGVTLREHLFGSIVGTSYLGVRYHERGTEPSPAVLDASCCGDNGCFPARIEEGVSIVSQAEPFPRIADPYADALASLDACFGAEETTPPPDEAFPFLHNCRRCLCEYTLGSWRGLPGADDPCHTHALPVVPLAIVRWDRFARPNGASRILAVDNCAIRPLAPGVPVVRALLQAITLCTSPGPRPPRFVALAPEHRGELVIESGATSARIVARSSIPISAPSSVGWTLDVFRDGNNPVLHFSNTTPPTTQFRVTVTVENDAAGRPVDLALGFSAPNANSAFQLPPGTYVWRINLPGSELAARVTGTPLDGEPSPIRAVPSGDGRPGGVFESRFFVRQRPANV
jgi:hypothetical protein